MNKIIAILVTISGWLLIQGMVNNNSAWEFYASGFIFVIAIVLAGIKLLHL
jgi:hypothetical protein